MITASKSPDVRATSVRSPPVRSGALVERPPTQRSRVTNGRDLLAGIDQRSALARRYRDLVSSIAIDQGGADHLSESRLQLIRRFAGASALAEQVEARLAAGEPVDIGEYSQLTSTLVRLATRLGIDRRQRDVTLDPLEYAASYNSAEEDAA
jgi:hypothetical protein